ncbi:MAG: viologen exporter family transport system permease protein [Actinomycetota bacterium]|jgi:ABC-2 type transport system permease protein
MVVGAYPWVARASIRRYSTYRIATVGAIVESSIASMIRAFVLLAAVHVIGTVRGLHAIDAATYAFLAGAIDTSLQTMWPTDIDDRIKTGEVIVDLQRPVDFQLWWFAHEAGRSVFMTLTRGIPSFLFGVVVLGIVVPHDLGATALFALSLALAFVVAFATRFILSLSGFWLLDTRGTNYLVGAIITFTSGSLLPLAFYPERVANVMRVLPFVALIQTPFEVFTSSRPAVPALASQAAWAIALLLLGRAVLARAMRKVVIQGG